MIGVGGGGVCCVDMCDGADFFVSVFFAPSLLSGCNSVCNFFGFVSRFLILLVKNQKTSRKPKKTRKQNCKTHVGTSW